MNVEQKYVKPSDWFKSFPDDSEEEYEDELVEVHEGIVNDDINMVGFDVY